MRVTRIEIQGDAKDGRFATITRKTGSEHIEVTIITPAMPDGQVHHVPSDDKDEVIALARRVQETLDGVRGTNSMAYDYYLELERFMD